MSVKLHSKLSRRHAPPLRPFAFSPPPTAQHIHNSLAKRMCHTLVAGLCHRSSNSSSSFTTASFAAVLSRQPPSSHRCSSATDCHRCLLTHLHYSALPLVGLHCPLSHPTLFARLPPWIWHLSLPRHHIVQQRSSTATQLLLLHHCIPTKWCTSLKPDTVTHCKSVTGVSDDRPVCHHPISQPHDVWWLWNPSRSTPRTTRNSYKILHRVSTTSLIEVSSILQDPCLRRRTLGWTIHVRRLSYMHSHTKLMEFSVK